jgi:hypothetical protein
MSDQWPYYKGLEAALANNRFWKSMRVHKMTESELRREVEILVGNGGLEALVPYRYKRQWGNRTIESEPAFLVVKALRRPEFRKETRARRTPSGGHGG